MAEQNVILRVLADVAGANASFAKMQKALSSLSNGALTLGKNFNVFQKGVQGSIGAQQAADAVAKQYLATMRARLSLSKAEASGIQALTVLHKAEAASMQAKLAVMKAEAAADDLALKQMQQELSLRKLAVQEIELENRERRALNASKVASVSATSAATGAVASNTAAMQENNVAAGAATFALTSLGQGLADAGQFGMGFAQGMRAITNNAQQVVFAMVMLRHQAGSAAASFAMLRSVMTGPLGFLFAFQAGSAALEGFLSWQQRAKKGNKELADSFKELISVMGGLDPIPMALSDIESRIDGLRSEMNSLGLAAEPFLARIILIRDGYLGLGDLFSDAASRGAELREEIRKWQELITGPVPFISEDERFRGVTQAELDDLGKKMGEFSDQIKLNADPAIRELREQVSLFEDAAKSGAGSVGEFSEAYASFSSRLASVADGVSITRAEFAKLMSEGRVEEFLKEERLERRLDALAKKAKDAYISGIEIAPLEFVDLLSLDPRDPAATVISNRFKEIARSATLVGQLGDFQGVGGGEIRQMSDATLSEMDRLGAEIEARNRAGTDSWAAHWLARTEATMRSAEIMSQAIGGIGTSFMQIAQAGDSSNKRLFETGKKFAIAQALISTYVGFTKALEQGGPLGIATGAAVIAAGMAKVAAIRATTMSGGGGGRGSGGGGVSGISSAPSFFTGFTNTSQIPASSPGFPVVPLGQRSQQQVNFVIDGRNLVGVLENNSAAQQRMTGRSMVVGTASSSGNGGFVDLTLER